MCETLFIIGNGFDLSHNLNTSYNDLKKYIKIMDFSLYKRINDQIFIGDENLWSSFESKVGTNIDFLENGLEEISQQISSVLDEAITNPDPMDGDVLMQQDNIQESINQLKEEYKENEYDKLGFNELYYEFIKYLEDMLNVEEKNISNKSKIKSIETLLRKNNNCKILTFNYTNTLEIMYGVDKNKIKHIHGKLNEDELIFGNKINNIKNLTDDFSRYIDEIRDRYNNAITSSSIKDSSAIYIDLSDKVDDLNDSLNMWSKDSEIYDMNLFLKSDKIQNIYVLGHSLGEVDKDYFEELDKKYPKAKWNVSYHNANGKQKMLNNFKKIISNKTPYLFKL
ncbi:hypothetical protein HW41_04180 [Apilactobacillus kunkeei]|uniref:AbiH family protein n=1 Tax=Apilactobacillus kunkeei TaxID=148814 RepID=UPI00059B46D4|nr:AbiH family protein [Apilactobacillus kunkeei]KIM18677.1 hypothetical protein HW41_04180 [Apilactobacillus kunkeei]MBX8455359.1 bacteriophage abortive infection AbiH family protein [Apilactobacillus kunkeei]MCK8618128.1 bacteriophage abortive infection AbiH family protein [Apilactobacillus kunkeei]QYU54876.1 bacteriophage abortive infection AbiH family protein [Apilactobacillus kunkeei]CAI2582240.1 hypothetical protein AKUH4B114J_05050 [Apilactobacillus kunkeei]